MKPEEGYVSHPQIEPELVGRTALVMAVLRPSGRVIVDGRYYDAAAEDGLFVARGRTVTVTRIEGRRALLRPAGAQNGVKTRAVITSGEKKQERR